MFMQAFLIKNTGSPTKSKGSEGFVDRKKIVKRDRKGDEWLIGNIMNHSLVCMCLKM